MGKFQTLGELGGLASIHVILSKILTQERGRKIFPDCDDEEIARKRTLICAAGAALIMSQRWQQLNKSLILGALLTKYLNLFSGPDNYNKAMVSSLFCPIGAIMFRRWGLAAAGKDRSVHPEFVGTMGKLLGFKSQRDVRNYALDPRSNNIGYVQPLINGMKYSLRVLSTVYVMQAIVGFAMKKSKKLSMLVQKIKDAFKKAIRTSLIYQCCASYSTWAYIYYGNTPPVWAGWATLVFFFEPLPRFATITEYYCSHFASAVYQDFRYALGRSSSPFVASGMGAFHDYLMTFGIPSMLLIHSLTGSGTPLPFMKSLTQ
eukprot:TRINITY_DN305_c1_g1_i1.p1 TRINITY_DN305_c1_g1~~TRINITY_DN305_c1_g1_i1.p1  ORF type:complete len:340 (+),score=34.72 TRINITY_DN305_c1_g1_i1:70-1020(+)